MGIAKEFSLEKWRETYDRVHALGAFLKTRGKHNLVGAAQKFSIENEISELLQESDASLPINLYTPNC